MQFPLTLGFAALASATTYSITAYAPGTNIDGALLNAAGQAFYTGVSGPATYCPTNLANCPAPQGSTLVYDGLAGMAVEVPGGQQIYVAPNGQVKYTQAHSAYIPPGSLTGGWFNQTIVFDCGPVANVLNFLSTDGSNIGGLALCPDIPNFMANTGASYTLYAKTKGFNLANCIEPHGLALSSSSADVGCWQYL